MSYRIGFIGAGKMAEALIHGLISSKVFKPSQIFASDPDLKRIKYLRKIYRIKISIDNKNVLETSRIIILAVKPQVMTQVLEEFKKNIHAKKLIISIAAGITIKKIQKFFPKFPIVRIMPNNPALVGEAMSAMSFGRFVQKKDMQIAEKIFCSFGKVILLPEQYLNAVTALSGSGPAFIYKFFESFIKAGQKINLSSSVSKKLILQTFIGSAKMLLQSGKSPEELTAMVKSPGGTTEAGLKVLEEKGFEKIIEKCVVAAKKRAEELSR